MATECKSCGELTDGKLVHNLWPRCRECFAELVHGVLHNPGPSYSASVSATKDDISPWDENAIRAMEDAGEPVGD